MNPLTCPVCGHTEISGNSCPNCDTDLSLIRLLTCLPQSSPQSRAGWQLGVALLMLMIGIGLGAVGSFVFLQPPQLLTKTVIPTQVTVSGSRIAQVPVSQQIPSQPTQYTVKSGDNLSVITEQYCGKGNLWQVMVEANPQLQGRENYLNVGEVLKLPNCK